MAEGGLASQQGDGSAAGLGADVGGSFIKFAAVHPDGACGTPRLVPTPVRDWPQFCATMSMLCRDHAPDVPLCLSIAGVVDPDTHVAFSANLPCISGRRLAAELGTHLGRPVRVANDADCTVLAEALRGVGVGHRVVFGIVLGSGVGGGLVVDGAVVRGVGGITGEWGHGPILGAVQVGDTTVPPQPCGCGQMGCLDTLGGAHGLERLHRFAHGAALSSRTICGRWRDDDPPATRTVEAWLALVAGPLAVLVNATGAGIVPVAGGLGNDVRLVAALDHAVRSRVLRRGSTPVVVPSRFGDEAGLVGAALLTLGDRYEGSVPRAG